MVSDLFCSIRSPGDHTRLQLSFDEFQSPPRLICEFESTSPSIDHIRALGPVTDVDICNRVYLETSRLAGNKIGGGFLGQGLRLHFPGPLGQRREYLIHHALIVVGGHTRIAGALDHIS